MLIVYSVRLLALHTLGVYPTLMKLVQNVHTHTDMDGKWSPINSVTGRSTYIQWTTVTRIAVPAFKHLNAYNVYKCISIAYHQSLKL